MIPRVPRCVPRAATSLLSVQGGTHLFHDETKSSQRQISILISHDTSTDLDNDPSRTRDSFSQCGSHLFERASERARAIS